MVGGGEGAFIGAVHRLAAALDQHIDLVCGALSATPDKSVRSGMAIGLPRDRCYPDYRTLCRQELNLPEHERMQFVAIVTPNNTHFDIASTALTHGFHVLSDKPATFDLAEAQALQGLLQARRQEGSVLEYGLTHTYTGYPLVKEARQRIAEGHLGDVRKVLVEYCQGWLATETDNKQAAWRLDPQQAGASSSIGDIGVHAAHLAEYVAGQHITHLCADLTAFVPGRVLDDDGSMLLRFANGARGVLTASQVCVGEENRLILRVYGERGGLEWHQQDPNTLLLKWLDRPSEVLRTGGAYLGVAAAEHTRTPMGHPEGYIEAFANIYKDFAAQLNDGVQRVPGIQAALRGMAFIEVAVAAGASEQKWHELPATVGE